jgi:hypothetical protein
MASQKEEGSASGNLLTLVFVGAGEKSRTPDLRITNALLYQLSYTGETQDYSEGVGGS